MATDAYRYRYDTECFAENRSDREYEYVVNKPGRRGEGYSDNADGGSVLHREAYRGCAHTYYRQSLNDKVSCRCLDTEHGKCEGVDRKKGSYKSYDQSSVAYFKTVLA